MAILPVQNRPSELRERSGLAVDRETVEARLKDHARDTAGAFAPNTVRALAADSRVFSAWCAGQGREALPATPESVAALVDAMAEARAPATVRRYCASIASMHRAAGLAPPTAMQPVRLALRRMTRAKGGRQRQAEPLNRPALDRMLAVTGQEDAPRPIDLRDAALATVAHDTLLRRSELVSLYIEDLAPASDDGTTILVRKSKTDQAGEGVVKFLAPDTARSVRAYLDAIGAPTEGPLFRPVSRWGRTAETALESQEVPRLFRKLALAAGVRTARPHPRRHVQPELGDSAVHEGLHLVHEALVDDGGEVAQAVHLQEERPQASAAADRADQVLPPENVRLAHADGAELGPDHLGDPGIDLHAGHERVSVGLASFHDFDDARHLPFEVRDGEEARGIRRALALHGPVDHAGKAKSPGKPRPDRRPGPRGTPGRGDAGSPRPPASRGPGTPSSRCCGWPGRPRGLPRGDPDGFRPRSRRLAAADVNA